MREGIDVPEVSLVAILDADKEVSSAMSVVWSKPLVGLPVIVRRHHVCFDTITDSMQKAMDETARRRQIQTAYNEEHGIVPQTTERNPWDLISVTKSALPDKEEGRYWSLNKQERKDMIKKLEGQMQEAAGLLDFELAAQIRDMILEIKAVD